MNKRKTGLKTTKDVFSVSKHENYLLSAEGSGESLSPLFKLVTTFIHRKGKVHKSHLRVPKDSPLASCYSSSGTIQKTS